VKSREDICSQGDGNCVSCFDLHGSGFWIFASGCNYDMAAGKCLDESSLSDAAKLALLNIKGSEGCPPSAAKEMCTPPNAFVRFAESIPALVTKILARAPNLFLVAPPDPTEEQQKALQAVKALWEQGNKFAATVEQFTDHPPQAAMDVATGSLSLIRGGVDLINTLVTTCWNPSTKPKIERVVQAWQFALLLVPKLARINTVVSTYCGLSAAQKVGLPPSSPAVSQLYRVLTIVVDDILKAENGITLGVKGFNRGSDIFRNFENQIQSSPGWLRQLANAVFAHLDILFVNVESRVNDGLVASKIEEMALTYPNVDDLDPYLDALEKAMQNL